MIENVPRPSELKPPLSTRESAGLIDSAHALGLPRDHGPSRGLRRVAEAKTLQFVGLDTQGRPQWMTPRAARAWLRMRDAALRVGIELHIVSAFRSVEYQLGIIERKLARGQTMPDILRVSAAPGYSEHHSGRAFDLTTPGFEPLDEEFERSGAFAWLSTNAHVYGFTMSYPRGNRHGISYEPWHWCWREQRLRENESQPV